MEIKLLKQTDVSEQLETQLSELYLQLNSELKQLSLSTILEKSHAIDIVACLEKEVIIGVAMMANYHVISGHKGMIEDVVVAKDHRGKGIGRKLMEALLEQAKHRKLNDVLLFSGHHRTAAIALYKSLGFTLKNSGLYVRKIGI